MDTKIINRVSSYLDVKCGKVNVDKNKVLRTTVAGEEVRGLMAIVLRLTQEQKNSPTIQQLELASLMQWLEFAALHGDQMRCNPQHSRIVLKELNNYLETVSYLVGFNKSIADVVVYHLIYETISSLSPAEKEAHLNLSRWFDHLQQDDRIRQNSSLVNFTTVYISSRAAGRH